MLQNKVQLFCSHWKLQKKPQKKADINLQKMYFGFALAVRFRVEVHVCTLERETFGEFMFIISFKYLEFKLNNFKSLQTVL